MSAAIGSSGQIPNTDINLKKDVFNTAISANTNFFSADMTTDVFPTSDWDIYICMDTAGVLTLKRTKSGVTISETLNSGNTLGANSAFAFSTVVGYTETINFQYSVSANILKLTIEEVLMES